MVKKEDVPSEIHRLINEPIKTPEGKLADQKGPSTIGWVRSGSNNCSSA
jgi:hypothetical protein